MECTTKWGNRYRRWGMVAHTAAVIGVVILTAAGIRLESIGGWIACPPQMVRMEEERRKQCRGSSGQHRFDRRPYVVSCAPAAWWA